MIAAFNFSPFALYLAERSEPHRKNVPLVVVEEQRVLHANVHARRHGVVPDMRLVGARMRVNNLEVVEYTEPDLQHAWSAILQQLGDHAPWLEAGGRGRAFAQLGAGKPQDLADQVQALAAQYDVPVGLADDLETAELAAVTARPGEVRQVSSLESAAFVDRLPLHFLKAVGLSYPNYTRLHWLGVASVGSLARWSAPQIRSYLGGEGVALLPYLHGPRRTDLRPYQQPAVVRRSLVFTEPVFEPHQLHSALGRLSVELEKALDGRVAQRLTLTATTPGGKQRASRLAKRPLQQAQHIRQQALFALQDSRAEGRPVERLTLELASPTRIGQQEGLWPQRQRRQRALRAALQRFPASQQRIVWRDPYAQAADLAWRWEGYSENDVTDDTAQRPSARRKNARQPHPPTNELPAVTAAAVPLFDPALINQRNSPQPVVEHDHKSPEPFQQPQTGGTQGMMFIYGGSSELTPPRDMALGQGQVVTKAAFP